MERLISDEAAFANEPFAAAKSRGLVRSRQMLKSSGGTLSSELVVKVLGISVEAVEELRSRGKLLGSTEGQVHYYPSFQFENGKTIPGFEEVLAELKYLDPWMQMVFFTSPNAHLQGKTPIENLKTGFTGEIKIAASGFGEQGAK